LRLLSRLLRLVSVLPACRVLTLRGPVLSCRLPVRRCRRVRHRRVLRAPTQPSLRGCSKRSWPAS
ncbi:hypothetical protein Sste5344_009551, partial [Sporothrix stenoceras]